MLDEEKRIQLGILLKTLLGSENIYFQPPTNTQLRYPCFLYTLNDLPNKKANNNKYIRNLSFIVTYISKTPDLERIQQIHQSEGFEYQRSYTTEGLNHTVFKITI